MFELSKDWAIKFCSNVVEDEKAREGYPSVILPQGNGFAVERFDIVLPCGHERQMAVSYEMLQVPLDQNWATCGLCNRRVLLGSLSLFSS